MPLSTGRNPDRGATRSRRYGSCWQCETSALLGDVVTLGQCYGSRLRCLGCLEDRP